MLPTKPSRILIVRLSALGDVIQTLPVLSWIRTTYPEAVIGWLVEADAANLLQDNPLVDHLHVSHRKQWLRSLKNPSQWLKTSREIRTLIHQIRRVNYDVALDFQGLLKSSFSMYLTGIPHRIGFKCAREGAPLFYTQTCPLPNAFYNPNIPLIEHFKHLAETIGCNTHTISYPLPVATRQHLATIDRLLDPLGLSAPFIVFAPATQWPSKHWPISSWQQLLKRILDKTDFNVVLVGGPQDKTLTQSILSAIPMAEQQKRVLDVAGQTTLRELQHLFERAYAVVGLDSAPLHLAGAVGKARLIGIYGPTPYRRVPPPNSHQAILLSSEDTLSCQPCHQTRCPLGTLECMHRITPDQVLAGLVCKTPTATP